MSEKVLIVDDDAEFADLLGLLLSKKGFSTKIVLGGEEALKTVRDFSPAVILQDYMMPGLHGTDLLLELKSARPQAHVIIITAKGDEEAAVGAMKAGASDYIKKPFEIEKLLTTIDNVLRRKSPDDELSKTYQELLEMNHLFMGLTALSNALSSNMPLAEKYQAASGIVMHNTKADMAIIFLMDRVSKSLMMLASESRETEGAKECVLPKGAGLASYVAEIKKPAMVQDFGQEKRFKVPAEVHLHGIVSALAAPMMLNGSVKGVLVIYSKEPRTYSSFDMKLMSDYANQIVLAAENDHLRRVLGNYQKQWQVTVDTLPERVTIQDAEHRIIMANRAAAEMAGLGVGDLIGQKCCWVFHNQMEPIAGCPVAETIRTLKPAHKQITDGKTAGRFDIRSYPVLDDDGSLLVVVEYVKKIG